MVYPCTWVGGPTSGNCGNGPRAISQSRIWSPSTQECRVSPQVRTTNVATATIAGSAIGSQRSTRRSPRLGSRRTGSSTQPVDVEAWTRTLDPSQAVERQEECVLLIVKALNSVVGNGIRPHQLV